LLWSASLLAIKLVRLYTPLMNDKENERTITGLSASQCVITQLTKGEYNDN
jgi:hypothetical protein